MLEAESARPPRQRQPMRHEEFAATHGAAPDDLDKVEAFAHEHNLDIVEVNAAQRRVVLSGTVEAISAAFDVPLARYEHPGGAYRGRSGPIRVPENLAPIIQGVFGLDNRPQARPHLRLFQALGGTVQPHAGSLLKRKTMPKSLADMASEIIVAQVSHTPMSPEDISEGECKIFEVLQSLQAMEAGMLGGDDQVSAGQTARNRPRRSHGAPSAALG